MSVAINEETATTVAEATDAITLTAAAAAKLEEIMTEKGVRETHGLRVFVSGSGCSGLQYGMTFDNAPRPVDVVSVQHGLRVIIDPQSLQYMSGSQIDFIDGEMGAGFHIDNPNSVSNCSTGGCSGCH